MPSACIRSVELPMAVMLFSIMELTCTANNLFLNIGIADVLKTMFG